MKVLLLRERHVPAVGHICGSSSPCQSIYFLFPPTLARVRRRRTGPLRHPRLSQVRGAVRLAVDHGRPTVQVVHRPTALVVAQVHQGAGAILMCKSFGLHIAAHRHDRRPRRRVRAWDSPRPRRLAVDPPRRLTMVQLEAMRLADDSAPRHLPPRHLVDLVGDHRRRQQTLGPQKAQYVDHLLGPRVVDRHQVTTLPRLVLPPPSLPPGARASRRRPRGPCPGRTPAPSRRLLPRPAACREEPPDRR